MEEGKPRGQNRDALGRRLCPAVLSRPGRERRGRTWGSARGIGQAFGAGPAAAQMQRPPTAGETPGTHLGLSEPRSPFPKHGKNGCHVGRHACPRGSLAPLPGSSQQPALRAQPGAGNRRWRQRWVHMTESPEFTNTRPGSHGPTESLRKHCTAATKTHPKPEKCNRNYRNKNRSKELPSTASSNSEKSCSLKGLVTTRVKRASHSHRAVCIETLEGVRTVHPVNL